MIMEITVRSGDDRQIDAARYILLLSAAPISAALTAAPRISAYTHRMQG
jgi:hypothetical protein